MNFYFFDIIHFLEERGRQREGENREMTMASGFRGRKRKTRRGGCGIFSTGQTIYHSEKSRNDAFMRYVIVKNWGRSGVRGRAVQAPEQNK